MSWGPVVEAALPRLAKVLDDPVDELRVTDLVLHLCRQGELALQRRRAQDPLPLREDTHQLGVPVHLDELDQLRPVLVGHPILDVDLPAGLDVLEKRLLGHAGS